MIGNNKPHVVAPNGQQATQELPPKEIVQAALAEVTVLVSRKQETLEGIALFHSGVTDLLSTAAELDRAGKFGSALANIATGIDKICKAQGGILMQEIDTLTSRQAEMAAVLGRYDQRIIKNN